MAGKPHVILALAIIFGAIALVEGAMLFAGYHLQTQQGQERKRVWQLVEELESDKRALTESLCRAEGKPFIPVGKRELQPSDGWFDAKPQVRVVDFDERAG